MLGERTNERTSNFKCADLIATIKNTCEVRRLNQLNSTVY